jgi:transcription elongation factor GreA
MKLHTYTPQNIAIGSTVHIRDLETNEREVYTLTRPGEADIRRNRISSLSPIGKALYGKGSGDIVEVQAPGGIFRVEIEDVVPAAARQYAHVG